jgi:endonuclease-3
MTKKQKAQYIIDELERLYPETPVPLDHSDAYTLLIAVLLSAQCTDERVNKITPALFARANNPTDMITVSVEEIRAIIRPCGLSPRKSEAIYQLSHILLNAHQGEVPQSFEALEALPGVGHKTASVVMAQAGESHQGKMWKKPNATPKNSFQKKNGINCTCKSYFMGGNILQREARNAKRISSP